METAIKVPELVLLSRRNIGQKDLVNLLLGYGAEAYADHLAQLPQRGRDYVLARGPADLRQESASQVLGAIPETEIEGVFLVARGLVQLVDVGKRATSRQDPRF